ncbi:hypothetical protein DICPUDRAFT_82883 [Dictyostelium purpureum]|uniref:Uncharacterized protein n=1 Tax=Dictyostelium purpureum TaxID=5786 RepID=F0ZXX2_DICPU|nr:uncharacterized protein DICPUDRAFT_82883 [Dictyostelium purpureum]EGC31210.1 hypothetical protein DICPUDRAFT_82883 [Dictyostelium purpureum]|eukprot:XP_003292270.1 hypothetical protein DICPUDRAFT_82883 [Dictyostelium purpureum]
MDTFFEEIGSNNLNSFNDTQKNELLEVIKKTITFVQNNNENSNDSINIINNNNNNNNSNNSNINYISISNSINNNINNNCKFDFAKNKKFLTHSFKDFIFMRDLFLIKYPGLYSLIRWTTEIKKLPNESFGKDNLNDWQNFDLYRQVQYKDLVFKFAIYLKEQNPKYSIESIEDINVEPYLNDIEIHKIQFHIIEHFNYQVKKQLENHFYKKFDTLYISGDPKQQFETILDAFPKNSFIYCSLNHIYENNNNNKIDIRYLTFRLLFDGCRFKINRENKKGNYSIDNYKNIILPYYKTDNIDCQITNNNNKHYIDLKNNQPKKKLLMKRFLDSLSQNQSFSSSPYTSPTTSPMPSPISYSSLQNNSPVPFSSSPNTSPNTSTYLLSLSPPCSPGWTP